uniref:Uncharacterized protein n=1 Tax=Oryza meridionalis TaxID=40149 RepID=A0A0E0EBN4_9ORYZ
MPSVNGDSSADTTTRRNAEDFLTILLKVVSSPEVAGIDASGVVSGGGLRSLGADWNLIAAWRGLGNSGNGKDSPAVVDNVGFTATARLGGGMLREGAWVWIKRDGVKRRFARHDVGSKERERFGDGDDSSATTSAVFFAIDDENVGDREA